MVVHNNFTRFALAVVEVMNSKNAHNKNQKIGGQQYRRSQQNPTRTLTRGFGGQRLSSPSIMKMFCCNEGNEKPNCKSTTIIISEE
jgi:hypothetical protein